MDLRGDINKEIHLHAQEKSTILDLINNITRGTCMTFIIEPKEHHNQIKTRPNENPTERKNQKKNLF